jgi:hypothetical protein
MMKTGALLLLGVFAQWRLFQPGSGRGTRDHPIELVASGTVSEALVLPAELYLICTCTSGFERFSRLWAIVFFRKVEKSACFRTAVKFDSRRLHQLF